MFKGEMEEHVMRWTGVIVLLMVLGCEQKPAPEIEAKAEAPQPSVPQVSPTEREADVGTDTGASARILRPRPELPAQPDCRMISRDPAMSPDRVQIEDAQIMVQEGVYFDGKTNTIPPSSFGLLNEIAFEICANPSLGLVEIGVHTNSQGSDVYNLKMSQEKAEAIREYLADFIAPERLVARGFGEVQPIASNLTAEGRAQNSRVEFRILE